MTTLARKFAWRTLLTIQVVTTYLVFRYIFTNLHQASVDPLAGVIGWTVLAIWVMTQVTIIGWAILIRDWWQNR